MRQHFPFEFLNCGFGHIANVRMGIVVLQKNAISPIWSFLLNCFVVLVQLLNVELCIKCLVALKQFIKNYTFPGSPYTQNDLLRMKVLFCSQSYLFLAAKPFFSLLHIDMKAPFFIASHNVINTVTMCGDKVKQANWQQSLSIDFCCFRSMCKSPKCQVSEPLSHRVKMVYHSVLITIHLLYQFSGCLTWIFVKKLIQLLFIKLNWSTNVWSILYVKISIFEAWNVSKWAVLWDIEPSPYTAQMSQAVSAFLTLQLNAKSKWCWKMHFRQLDIPF